MERQVYRFAGRVVEICSLYPQVHALCAGYRTQDRAELSLSVDQSDIDAERRRSLEEGAAEDDRRDAYLETLAVYRKLAEGLIEYGVLLFHGSAVSVDGACYLFAAPSGAGKSTHARLWRELLGERAFMVNDDKPLLEITPAGVTVWGTPWDGKHHLSRNTGVLLRAIGLLERAPRSSAGRIGPKEALPALWRQTYKPSEPEKLRQALALTDALSKAAGLYRLRCTPDIEAARVAYGAMSKGDSP